jgi:hypothetical protein
LIGEDYEIPEFQLKVGINPTFLLEKDGAFEYAVINGFLIDLKRGNKAVLFDFASKSKNAMIYR